MTATEQFTSLDRTLANIREEHATTLKALEDRLLAAQIELELHKAQLKEAKAESAKYQRLAVKFITQFSTVEKVFAEAKELALHYTANEAAEETKANIEALKPLVQA